MLKYSKSEIQCQESIEYLELKEKQLMEVSK